MASQRHYQYRPLEKGRCIRLLRLEPGDAAAAQKISIFHADLDQQATYEALSYTWGDPDDTTLISCTEEGSTLAVTRNCEAALRSLRLEYEERTLWIDAICIDQSNVDERGQQVRLMSDIYKQAQQVIAYLGEASHDSQVGMDFILHDLQAISAAGEDRPSVGLSADSPSSPQQMAIDHILTRPYFERIWIIQEIVFARQVNIVLGDRTVDWEAFKRTAYYVDINKQVLLGGDRKPPRVLKYKDRATSFTSGKVSTSKPDALLELLRDMRMCKATDPRDKIHALLGMSVEKNEAALAPDYGLATRETFINLVKFLIGRDRRLDVLCHVQGKLPRHDLPSWVPDWSFPYSCHVFSGPYKASQGRLANVVFEHDPDVLVAEGKVFDKVSQVGPAYSLDGVSSFKVLQQWESMASTSSTNINASATFTNTLIAYPPYLAPNPFLRFYPSWRRRISSDSDISMDELSKASIFEEQVSKACNGRRLFLTEKGHIGLGPKDMQEGDVVAVLLGGSVPFVLHRQVSKFTLLGESYIHGMMNGEVIEDENVDLEMLGIV